MPCIFYLNDFGLGELLLYQKAILGEDIVGFLASDEECLPSKGAEADGIGYGSGVFIGENLEVKAPVEFLLIGPIKIFGEELNHCPLMDVVGEEEFYLAAGSYGVEIYAVESFENPLVMGRIGFGGDIYDDELFDPIGGIDGELHHRLSAERMPEEVGFLDIVIIHIVQDIACKVIVRHSCRVEALAVVAEVEEVYGEELACVSTEGTPIVEHPKKPVEHEEGSTAFILSVDFRM